MSNLTYKISEDENTVLTTHNVYEFTQSRKGCYRCELLSLCIHESSDDNTKDFPFPCLPENRKDKQKGIFLSKDSLNRQNNMLTFFIVVFFMLFAFLVYFKMVPNFLKMLLC